MISRLFKALLIGVCCAATGLAILCLLWKTPFPYDTYAVQEFATAKPEQGFEYAVGYTGSQLFFWDEIVTSRDFKFRVLKESGISPEKKWGLIPGVSVDRYLTFDRSKKESLYLTLSYPESAERAEHYRQSMVSDFGPISRAFVEASRARGVDVTPVGEIAVYTIDHSSSWAVIERNWQQFALLSCATSLLAAFFTGKRKEMPNQSRQTTPVSAPR